MVTLWLNRFTHRLEVNSNHCKSIGYSVYDSGCSNCYIHFGIYMGEIGKIGIILCVGAVLKYPYIQQIFSSKYDFQIRHF